MRTFTINVSPARFDNRRTRDLLWRWVKESRWAAEYLLDEGNPNDGEYWHLSFKSDRPRRCWFELKRFIDTELPRQATLPNKPLIVVLEGEHGWDDYLLLYHHNGRTQLDSVESIPEAA